MFVYLHLDNLDSVLPLPPKKMWLVSSLVKIGHVNLEKINVYRRQCILPNYHLLQNGMALNLNNCEFRLFKDAFCQVWFMLAHWFFKCLQCTFANTFLSPSGKREWPFVWTISKHFLKNASCQGLVETIR